MRAINARGALILVLASDPFIDSGHRPSVARIKPTNLLRFGRERDARYAQLSSPWPETVGTRRNRGAGVTPVATTRPTLGSFSSPRRIRLAPPYP